MQHQDVTPSIVIHIWKNSNTPNIKKQTRRTDICVINYGEFPSLSLKSPSVTTSIQYLCYFMMAVNQVQVWINYDIEWLPKRIGAEIVYHQLLMLQYFICVDTFLELFFLIYQKYTVTEQCHRVFKRKREWVSKNLSFEFKNLVSK